MKCPSVIEREQVCNYCCDSGFINFMDLGNKPMIICGFCKPGGLPQYEEDEE